MAKLNITFVDELGNNLNRYKAIDINTNEEFIFDLSRDGTITTPGTPLNAERLNAIVNAINSMDTEKQSQIDTLKNETKELREDFDNSFTEKSVTRKIRKLVDYPSKEISYPDQNVTLKQLGGMSYKYNQLINNPTAYNSTTTINNYKCSYVSGSGTMSIFQQRINFIGGHKYYVSIPKEITKFQFYNILSGGESIWSDGNSIFSVTNNINNDFIFQLIRVTETGFSDFYLQLVDLTAMYGAGNEPTTAAQFLNDYPMYNDYVEYTEGDIINAAVSSVDSVGANIWDEEWELGSIYPSDGSNADSTTKIRSKNYIKVKPNTEYFYVIPSINNDYFYFYDKDKKFISNSWHNSPNGTFTTPTNCEYLRFIANGTTYNNNICINVSNDSFNGTYSPYKHNIYPIPSSIQSLEGYGWGVNDSCNNYIDFDNKKFVKKVGRVDMGTLDYSLINDTNYPNRFGVVINDMKPSSANNIMIGYTNKGVTGYGSDLNDDKSYGCINNNINIHDSNYTDAATFKAAMSGVYLYYELATPVEIDIVALNNYPVWQYGTETQNAILPAIMVKEYSISTLDQIVKNIEVDANQTDMIEKLVEKDSAIDNSIKDITNQQTNHSSAISDLSDRVVDLELEKFDKSKLTIEQNLVNTILKYNNVEIDRIENLDVAYLPNIVFDVYRDSQYTAQEKVTITNSTDMDMYVSIKGLKEHNNLSVPYGESVTSTLDIDLNFPDSYIATIEIKIYYNPKTNYSSATGYTLFENVKTINLRATVHTTDR